MGGVSVGLEIRAHPIPSTVPSTFSSAARGKPLAQAPIGTSAPARMLIPLPIALGREQLSSTAAGPSSSTSASAPPERSRVPSPSSTLSAIQARHPASRIVHAAARISWTDDMISARSRSQLVPWIAATRSYMARHASKSGVTTGWQGATSGGSYPATAA